MSAPAELGAQDLVVAVSPGVQQASPFRVPSDLHAGFAGEIEAGLAVAGDPCISKVVTANADLDAAAPWDHQWAVAQIMGADRHQEDGIESRVHQWSAAGPFL